jgi:hypothetical protein
MNPYRPYRLSAVPRTLHTQLEIAKAIRALLGPDQHELLLRRRAEIAAVRRDLDALVRDVHKLGEELPALVMAELQSELKKYSPDQPRVPAGNADGGQWTSGGKAGSDSPSISALLADEARDSSGARIHYASLENSPAGTDVGSSKRGFVISASQIPADSPKRPVPFVDSFGEPVTLNGEPLLRPADLSPEMMVSEGIAFDFKDRLATAQQGGMDQVAMAWVALAIQLTKFKHDGPWDAERIAGDHVYVRDYHDPANIFIGLHLAAAGVPLNDGLRIADTYAWLGSSFQGPKDDVYTHMLKQDVIDIKMGYDLYRRGRIRP